jgi:hypothetical protein
MSLEMILSIVFFIIYAAAFVYGILKDYEIHGNSVIIFVSFILGISFMFIDLYQKTINDICTGRKVIVIENVTIDAKGDTVDIECSVKLAKELTLP